MAQNKSLSTQEAARFSSSSYWDFGKIIGEV